jgi:hypothetical protein
VPDEAVELERIKQMSRITDSIDLLDSFLEELAARVDAELDDETPLPAVNDPWSPFYDPRDGEVQP